MSEQILDMSAEKIAEGVGSRKLSASEVASAFIKRIEEVNPVINAICTLNDTILEEARAIDERLASGGKPRPLEGVPFLIKIFCKLRVLERHLVHCY